MAAWDIKGRDALSATGGVAGGPSPWIQGDWNVNVAGTAPALQAAAGAGSLAPLLIAAAVVGVAWLLLRRK